MEHQTLIFSNDIVTALASVLKDLSYNKIFVIVDSNVQQYVMPKFKGIESIESAYEIVIKPGDVNKNLNTLADVWKQLAENKATRNSLVINIGGGVVTDLGGFAASTFKRGVKFVNIPTTLLGAVDAAVGGKTGINFHGLKNEIGVFNEAQAVIVSTCFFNTLPLSELKSGYAEMLKHGLLSNMESFSALLKYDFANYDSEVLLQLLEASVEVKRNIVAQDPHEQGLRRALNLGHTSGHAFESLALERNNPIPHGYAVAWGIVVELILSNFKEKFDSKILDTAARYIYNCYGNINVTCDDYPQLISLMRHDKKSINGELNFTLVKKVGDVKVDCVVTEDEVKEALDIFRDYMHI